MSCLCCCCHRNNQRRVMSSNESNDDETIENGVRSANSGKHDKFPITPDDISWTKFYFAESPVRFMFQKAFFLLKLCLLYTDRHDPNRNAPYLKCCHRFKELIIILFMVLYVLAIGSLSAVDIAQVCFCDFLYSKNFQLSDNSVNIWITVPAIMSLWARTIQTLGCVIFTMYSMNHYQVGS